MLAGGQGEGAKTWTALSAGMWSLMKGCSQTENWSPPTLPSEESVILEGNGEGKNLSVIPSLLILI